MKAGDTLQGLSQRILDQTKAKKDYLTNTRALTVKVVNSEVPGQEKPRREVALAFTLNGQERVYRPTKLCLEQMADRTGIPLKYTARMAAEAPELLAQNINHWFQAKPEDRMLRTFNNGQGVARAFLSKKYRVLDNYDLAETVIPRLLKAGCEIRSAEITETRLYIQASTPRIQAEIDQITKIGGHHRIKRTIEAGVIIGNSEVGRGGIFVDPMLYDLVCTNGLIIGRTLKRHHVGRANEGVTFGDEETSEMFSDDTRKLDDKAFWSKVCDVVDGSLDKALFDKNIDNLRKTQTQTLGENVQEIVEVAADRLQLDADEKNSLLLHFAQGGDYSGYGLIQAVTRTAEDCPSYDRAVELERAGGVLLMENDWSAYRK
jgi:hypothetical protein